MDGSLRQPTGGRGQKAKALPATWPPPGPITQWPTGDLELAGVPVAVVFDHVAKAFPDGVASIPADMLDPAPKNTMESVQVVGVSSFQGSLEAIAGGHTNDGPRNRDHTALLLPEPTNPHDPNAVRVVVVTSTGVGATIGYLSRADAVAYRPVIDRLAAQGNLIAVRASLSGGRDRGDGDRGSFGVRLSMGTPEELVQKPDG